MTMKREYVEEEEEEDGEYRLDEADDVKVNKRKIKMLVGES